MFGLKDFLLGGLAPACAAAVALAIGWFASRRAGACWSAGVFAGYATGFLALAARDVGFRAAVMRVVSPHDAAEWLPLIAALGVAPAIVAARAGNRRWAAWLVAAPWCVAAPLRLLWGGKYLPTREVRAAGFAFGAWSLGQAALVLGGVAVAMFAAWALWQAQERAELPRLRAILATIATIAAAATVGLTGSFSYAQAIGVVAASLGGCTVAAWAFGVKAGPEAAAGPTILLIGCLLALAACYSALPPWQAVVLWLAIIVAAGRWPNIGRSTMARGALRTVLVAALVVVVVGKAAVDFARAQSQQSETSSAIGE